MMIPHGRLFRGRLHQRQAKSFSIFYMEERFDKYLVENNSLRKASFLNCRKTSTLPGEQTDGDRAPDQRS